MTDQLHISAARVEEKFRTLKTKWKDGTRFLSDATRTTTHPAYQRIIGLGPAVVPILLRELQTEPDWWFWALECITGECPTSPESRGRVDRMAAEWLQWARNHPEWAPPESLAAAGRP